MYLDCSLFIIVIKAIQPDCDKIKGISVLLLETPLTRSKYISPYTHAQHLTRTSRTFYTFAYKLPHHWWSPMSRERRGETNSGSSVADCIHTAIFQNTLRKLRTVASNANRIQGRVHTHADLRSTKEIDKRKLQTF